MNDVHDVLIDPDPVSYSFPCMRATQPVGDLFICSVPHNILSKITFFDVRRVIQERRDVERYLGIQRPLDKNRVRKLEEYVNYYDASFPTAIIIAVDEKYATFDEDKKELTVSNVAVGEDKPSIAISYIGRVLDGQHRIAGLYNFEGDRFELPVTVFIGADMSDQAHIFATVNLEQTKVHKNLVYDLYSLAKSRSPQKTCHNIAVALDQDENSPLHNRIRRLGGATVGRTFEPISQATFVESLLRYISSNPKADRDTLLRGKKLEQIGDPEIWKFPFRNTFIKGDDIKIGEEMLKLFNCVKERWPDAWDDQSREGLILNRTNGFRAVMRLYGYLYNEQGVPGGSVNEDFIRAHLEKVPLENKDFTIENFVPGSSGEGRMYRVLTLQETLDDQQN